MIDENAGKHIYTYYSDELYKFASSEEVKAMRLFPFKCDPYGEYADELIALKNKYDKTPYDISADYYMDIISGTKKVYDTWDDYYTELEKYGLHEYNELIAKYPVTNAR